MSPAESIQLHLNAAYSLSHGRRCPSGSEAASHALAIVQAFLVFFTVFQADVCVFYCFTSSFLCITLLQAFFVFYLFTSVFLCFLQLYNHFFVFYCLLFYKQLFDFYCFKSSCWCFLLLYKLFFFFTVYCFTSSFVIFTVLQAVFFFFYCYTIIF